MAMRQRLLIHSEVKYSALTENVTLSAWINSGAVDTAGAVVISMGTTPALYLNPDGTLIGFYESGGVNNVIQSTESLVGTGWRHVAVSIDGNNQTISIFIDGVEVDSATTNGPIDYDNDPDTYIGRAGDGLGGFDFTGQIDDVRIYDRALSAEEIATLSAGQASETIGPDLTPIAHSGDAAAFDLLFIHKDFEAITSDGSISMLQIGPDSDNTPIDFDFLVLRPNGGDFDVVHRVSLTDADIVSTNSDGVRTLDIGSLAVESGHVVGHWSTMGPGSIPYSDDTGGSTGWSTYSDSRDLGIGSTVQEDLDGAATPNRLYRLNVEFQPNTTTQQSDGLAITVDAVNDAPTFAIPGESIFTEGQSSSYQNRDSVVLSDGSMLLTPLDNNGDPILVKLNDDGSIDTSFGSDGYADNSSIGFIEAIAEQSDGKIIVSGIDGGDIFVARYNADGTLDSGFGTSGVTTLATAPTDTAYDIAVQSDGSIVLIGNRNGDTVLTRVTSTGLLDTGFGTSGSVSMDLGSGSDYLNSITLQSDDSIIAVGETHVFKLDSDGAFDTSFDTDGILDLGVDVRGVTVQSDDKFVVTGGDGSNLFVMRFNADGSVDTDFATSGTATWSTSAATGHDIAQQADGKLVVTGFTDSYPSEWVVLDTSFGSGGAWVMDNDLSGSEAYSISLYDDGTSEKIVLGGYTTREGFDYLPHSTMVRLNHDGSLDTTLGTNTLDGNRTYVEDGAAVVLDSDVKIFDADINLGEDTFENTTLTLSRNGGADSEDVFSESGLLGALTDGGNLIYNSVTVGTVTSNSGGTLLLTFDATADNDTVNGVMQAIAYSNSSDTPPASVQIDWSFNDHNDASKQGSGGELSATGFTTVTITAVNDVPVATGNTVVAVEDTPLLINASDFSFTDAESDSLVSVTFSGLNLNGGTLTHSSGAVTVTNGMTVTAAELADLTFTSALNDSTDSNFSYTVNDADNGVTSATMNIRRR